MNVKTIIVTWNQTELTLKCLRSLTNAQVDLASVWVVDNASDQPALPVLQAEFPAIQGLRLDANRGFAGGCNIGASYALAADPSTEAIFLLNNDAEIEPDAFDLLVNALKSSPDVAAVSPKVYYTGTERVIQSTGLTVDRNSGQARMLGSNHVDHAPGEQVLEREALFGCAMLIRAEVWQATQGFWEPFFNYAEEVDWCMRVRQAGWRLLYVPTAVVWHYTSSSLGWNSALKVYLMARNQWWLRLRHNMGGLAALRGWLYAVYIFARTAFRYVRHGQALQAWAIWLAWWDYWRGLTGDIRTKNLKFKHSPQGSSMKTQIQATKLWFGRTVNRQLRRRGYEVLPLYRGGQLFHHLWHEDQTFVRLFNQIVQHSLVDKMRAFMLYQFAQHALHLAGEVAEIGVYKGGTAYLLANIFADSSKTIHLFDTFEGMPPTDKDKDLHGEGDFADTSLESVQNYLKDCVNVAFHQGFFPTTGSAVSDQQFCFVHVDVDIYRSVLDCCSFFYPRLVQNGILIFDDYGFFSCPGAKQAVDEFFADKPEHVVYLPTGQAMVIRS